MPQKIRWGVLGYARIARLSVLPAIRRAENAQLVAVASRDPAKLAECNAEFGPVRGYADYAALLADPDIDAVYVPLPNSLHRQWAIAALQAGKHVLCEKPLALTAAEVREMIAAAEASGRVLMEAFMYRYSARTALVQEVLASGALGALRHINASFRFWLDREGTIKEQAALGGGALYDVGCYPVNFLGLVTGQQQPLACQVQATLARGVDVNVSAILMYPNDLIANIHCGFNAFGRNWAEIIGTDGLLEIPEPFQGNAGELRLSTRNGVRTIPVPESDRYALQIQAFSAGLLAGTPQRMTLAESLGNAEVLDRLLAEVYHH